MSDRTPWGMTLRELLECLRATNEESLDMEVVVCHTSGGYSPISHTSVLPAGLPVIHLAEPKATEAVPNVWSGSGDAVAEVDPDDLRSVWRVAQPRSSNSVRGGLPFAVLFLAKGGAFDFAFSCSSHIHGNHSTTLIAVRPSISSI